MGIDMSPGSTTVLAAEGGNNFLIPDATFFFVLVIFLIVLGVIGKWVVPPILKVLHERTKVPVAEYIREGIDMVLKKNEHLLPGQQLALPFPERKNI